jgi:hypothetical protein
MPQYLASPNSRRNIYFCNIGKEKNTVFEILKQLYDHEKNERDVYTLKWRELLDTENWRGSLSIEAHRASPPRRDPGKTRWKREGK